MTLRITGAARLRPRACAAWGLSLARSVAGSAHGLEGVDAVNGLAHRGGRCDAAGRVDAAPLRGPGRFTPRQSVLRTVIPLRSCHDPWPALVPLSDRTSTWVGPEPDITSICLGPDRCHAVADDRGAGRPHGGGKTTRQAPRSHARACPHPMGLRVPRRTGGCDGHRHEEAPAYRRHGRTRRIGRSMRAGWSSTRTAWFQTMAAQYTSLNHTV